LHPDSRSRVARGRSHSRRLGSAGRARQAGLPWCVHHSCESAR